jgi:cytochrome c oxidase assembly protein subunit 15
VIWLNRYQQLLVVATLLLVTAGGMVTSTSSGLSVPDWPTTYGYSMFTFPLSKMVGGIFYEHSHRLIASSVGMLTIGLVLFQRRREPRRTARRLGWVALGAVILQGLLGGLTVIFFLPPAISVAHAGLAQLFFITTVTIALVTSRGWLTPARAPVDDAVLWRRAIVLPILVYAQILVGATMRHLEAGLAIPDFPLTFGHLLPPVWTAPIAIHFAHRVGAVIVTSWMLFTVASVLRRHPARPELTRVAWFLVIAVATQVTLGALVVLSAKDPVINTAHVATGAVVFATSVVLALRLSQARLPSLAWPPVAARRA